MGNGNYGNGGRGQRRNYDRTPPPKIERLNLKWITGKESMGIEMVEWAKNAGKVLKDGKDALTTSQIRKFYGEIKRIQADFEKYKDDVPMLNAKLAYAVGRNKSRGRIKDFAETFEEAIYAGSESEENFNRLVKVLEATVAYHKYYGGKD